MKCLIDHVTQNNIASNITNNDINIMSIITTLEPETSEDYKIMDLRKLFCFA